MCLLTDLLPRLNPPAKPVDDRWPELPEIQFSATEFLEVLGEIHIRRDQEAADARELQWEHDTLLRGMAV